MIFVGIDWAEHHHDVCLVDSTGQVLATGRVADGVQGVSRLHELVAAHAEDPAAVVVGIETDRGLLVGALTAAGYQVYGINPLQASRYRERHVPSGAKSDAGMRGCWPRSSAATGIITASSLATATKLRRSRSSPGRTRG